MFISPILVTKTELERVILNNRSVSKIRVIGKDQPMDAKRLRAGDSELIQVARLIAHFGFDDNDDNEELMHEFTTGVQNSLDPASLKILIEDIGNHWNIFKKSRRVRDLLK